MSVCQYKQIYLIINNLYGSIAQSALFKTELVKKMFSFLCKGRGKEKRWY